MFSGYTAMSLKSFRVEARTGIEPISTDFQAVA